MVGTPEFDPLIDSATVQAWNIINNNTSEANNQAPLNNQDVKTDVIKQPDDNEKQNQKFQEDLESALHKKLANDARNKPISSCESALKNLGDIDQDIVDRWTDEKTRSQYIRLLNDLSKVVEELKKHVA